MTEKVCFVGGARYGSPLDATAERKFSALKTIGQLFVVGFSTGMRPRRFSQHANFYLLPDLPVRPVRYLLVYFAGPILVMWLAFRHGVRIFIAQSPYEGFAVAVAKRIAGLFNRSVALVVESHGDFDGALFLQHRVLVPWLYRRPMRFLAGYSLRNADILRAVSEFTAGQLREGAPGIPLHVFPAWTDIEAFRRAGAARSVESPGTPGQEILYAGVLTPLKGVHHLIGAFSRLAEEFPRAELVLVGRGRDRAYSEELATLARQRGIGSRVRFEGELPQAELAERMARAAVLVLPSLSEGLGRVLIEAMAVGLPVVASAVSGIPELVDDGDNGFLCPPGDEEALANRLRWILDHPADAAAMGRRGRSRVEKLFSTELYVESYGRVVRAASEIADGRGKAA